MTEPAGELPVVRFPDDDNFLGPAQEGDGADHGDVLLIELDDEAEYAEVEYR